MLWNVLLENTFDSSLDCKEIQPVHPKGDQSWVFIGRTEAEAETLILWPPDVKSWLIGKDPDAGKDWGQEEKGKTEDEMVGWHHWLNGHGFGWTPGVGHGGLAAVHGVAKSQTRLNDWTELKGARQSIWQEEVSSQQVRLSHCNSEDLAALCRNSNPRQPFLKHPSILTESRQSTQTSIACTY